jgi:hypothetical protein
MRSFHDSFWWHRARCIRADRGSFEHQRFLNIDENLRATDRQPTRATMAPRGITVLVATDNEALRAILAHFVLAHGGRVLRQVNTLQVFARTRVECAVDLVLYTHDDVGRDGRALAIAMNACGANVPAFDADVRFALGNAGHVRRLAELAHWRRLSALVQAVAENPLDDMLEPGDPSLVDRVNAILEGTAFGSPLLSPVPVPPRRRNSPSPASRGIGLPVVRTVQLPRRDRIALISGRRVELTPIELRILGALNRRRPELVCWSTLQRLVWGAHPPSDRRSLDAHLSHLRAKLAPDDDLIVTVPGQGLRLASR